MMRFGWLLLLLGIIWPDVPVLCEGTPAFFMGKGQTGEKPQAKSWYHNGFWWCAGGKTEKKHAQSGVF
jgi:hypothetical protein